MQPLPPRHPRHARGGSVLLLVVASIAMLAFLGGLFLVTTHTQRFRTPDTGSDRSATRQSDANLVLQSVHEEIARQIKNDVFNPPGSFNEGAAFDGARGVEPTDRPWLNPAVTGERETTLLDGTRTSSPGGFGAILGGELDDTWLASSFPHRENGAANGEWVWSRITSLTGGSFRVGDQDARLLPPFATDFETGNDRFVRDRASGENLADYYETELVKGKTFNIPAYGLNAQQEDNPNASGDNGPGAAPLLVDADGDGVPDARFERAPLATLDGLEYFMAVRVVDLASLLNLNAAGAAADVNGAYSAGEEPLARHPGDLGAGQFFGLNQPPGLPDAPPFPYLEEWLGTNGTPARTGLLGIRAAPVATPGDALTKNERDVAYEAAHLYSASPAGYAPLPQAMEADLRHRMGLYDNPDNDVLRTYAPRIAVEPRTQSTTRPTVQDHRNNPLPRSELDAVYGYNTLFPSPGDVVPTPFPRTYLTTRSASNLWRVPLPGEATGSSPTNPGLSGRAEVNADALRPQGTREGGVTTPNEFPQLTPAEATALETEFFGATGRGELFNVVATSTVAPATPVDGSGSAATVDGFRRTNLRPSPSTPDPLPLVADTQRPLLPRSAAAGTAGPDEPVFDIDTVDRFVTQFLASLQDYRDHDNRLTVLELPGAASPPTPGQQVYGMEALPAITEVYAHRRYEATAGTEAAPGSFDITWTGRGDVGFAVEIGNPFNRPIALHNVHLYLVRDDGSGGDELYLGPLNAPGGVAGTGLASDTPGALDPQPSGTPLNRLREANIAAGVTDDGDTAWDERDMLMPGDSVILYREADLTGSGSPATLPDTTIEEVVEMDDTGGDADLRGGVSVSETGFKEDPQPTPNEESAPDTTSKSWPDEAGTGADLGSLRLELRAESATPLTPANALGHGDILPFAYQALPLVTFPDTWEEKGAPANFFDPTVVPDDGTYSVPPSDPTFSFGFIQARVSGSDNGFNALLVPVADLAFPLEPGADSDELRAPRPGTTNDPLAPGFLVNMDQLGRTKDAPTGFTEIPVDEDQWPIRDDPDHRLGDVAEVAVMLMLAPQESLTSRAPLDAFTVADIFKASGSAAADRLERFRLRMDSPVAVLPGAAPADVATGGDPANTYFFLNDARLIDARARKRRAGEAGGGATINDFLPRNPAWHVPHFAHLLSSITTREDLYDSRGTNPTLIGPLNLNTVPLSLLADTLPRQDRDLRRQTAIAAGTLLQEYDIAADDGRTRLFDDEPAPSPGISYPWEMANPTLGSAVEIDFLATNGGDDFEVNGFRIDHLPNSEFERSDGRDDVVDDREEFINPVQVLNAVSTTRSDVFVAYILLHGYESALDPDDNVVKFTGPPARVLRAVTLFDRSQMQTVQDDVRIEVLQRLSESPIR